MAKTPTARAQYGSEGFTPSLSSINAEPTAVGGYTTDYYHNNNNNNNNYDNTSSSTTTTSTNYYYYDDNMTNIINSFATPTTTTAAADLKPTPGEPRTITLPAKARGFPLFGFLCFFIWGMYPWITVNALFTEMPIFLYDLPEGNKVASVLGTAVQVANVGPLLYMILTCMIKFNDFWFLLALQLLHIVDTFFLGFFWNHTVHNKSMFLYGFTFVSGLVGCTTVVIIYAFTSNYRSQFISAVSAGQAFSGLLVACLSLIQQGGAHSQVRFSVTLYFIIISGLLLLCLACFFIIVISSKRNPEYWKRDLPSSPLPPTQSLPSPPAAAAEQGPTATTTTTITDGIFQDPAAVTASPTTSSSAKKLDGGGGGNHPEFENYVTSNSDGRKLEKTGLLTADNYYNNSSSIQQEYNEIMPTPDLEKGSPRLVTRRTSTRARLESINMVFRPLFNIFITAAITYLIVPGLEPYLLTKNTRNQHLILLLISNGFVIFDISGRMLTTSDFIVRRSNVYITNLLQFLLMVFFILTCALKTHNFFINNSWILVPCMFAFAFLNGYTGTLCFCGINRDFTDATAREKASRWCGLCNQAGALTGTFVTLAAVLALKLQ